MAVQPSRYNRFAVAHFRHSAPGDYIFKGDIKTFYKQLRAFKQGRREEIKDAKMIKNIKN